MKLADWFKQQEEEPTTETTPEVEPEPQPQYATVDQMQQMISSVTERLQENLVNVIQNSQRGQQQEQPTQPQIQAPSLDDIAEAWEEGDTKKALQMQALREQALEQKFNNQLQAVYREGQGWVANVHEQLVDTAIPDYKKYKKEVDSLMEELGLPKESRSNPQLRKLLTDSVKGSKLDEILAERIEAQKRQENLESTTAPTNNRSNPSSAPAERVLSDDAVAILRSNGLDPDTYARKRGHGTWENYEKSAKAYQAYIRNEPSNYVPKWRRNKK